VISRCTIRGRCGYRADHSTQVRRNRNTSQAGLDPFSLASPPANIHATPIIARLPAWARPDFLLLTISMRNDICPIVEDGHQHHDRQHHVEFDSVRVDEASKVPSHHRRDSLSLIVPYGVAALRLPVRLPPLRDKKKDLQVFLQHHTIRTSSSYIRSTPLSYTGHRPMQNRARGTPLPWAVSSRYFSGARSAAFTMSRCQLQHQARVL